MLNLIAPSRSASAALTHRAPAPSSAADDAGEQDLIRATVEGTKKLYDVTAEGRAHLKENEAAVDGILTRSICSGDYSSRAAPESGVGGGRRR